MWRHCMTYPDIGVIGPLSNTASWQSVPKLKDGKDWANNELPFGMTVTEMSNIVQSFSQECLVVPFLNGFCYMIKKELRDQIGNFDEDGFGRGYGEENDFSIRARKAGWKLAIATDVFIYHSQSKSYTNDRRKTLSEIADNKLIEKHGVQNIQPQVEYCKEFTALLAVRAKVAAGLERYKSIKSCSRFSGKSVCFLLPTAVDGGGSNVVFQECKAMQNLGVDITVLNLTSNQRDFNKNSYAKDQFNFIYCDGENAAKDYLTKNQKSFDAVVATHFKTVFWMPQSSSFIKGYYIQDFEPYFFHQSEPSYEQALQSYRYHLDSVNITKSSWNQDEVFRKTGVRTKVVGPSVDLEMFYPSQSRELTLGKRAIRIGAMLRPSSDRRNPVGTLAVLEKLRKRILGAA